MILTQSGQPSRGIHMVVRTLKQKAYAGTSRTESGENRRREKEQGLSRQVGMMALWALVGLVVSRASIYGGMAPFGVGVAAAMNGPGAAVVYLAAVVGYLLPGGALLPIRYVAAVLAVAGIKWSLSGLKAITRHGIFAPLMAFLATGCTGLAMALVEGPSAYDILIVVAESLVAGGFAYFAAVAMQVIGVEREKSALTPQEQSSVMAVAAVILMAVAGIQFSGISPGRILSVLVILLMARCGKEQGGSIAGIVLGLCMAMAQPEHLYLAAAYSFGGLTAGIFSRFGRFASAGAFVVANTIVAVTAGTDVTVIIGVYEVAAASIIFVALPPVLDRRINAFFSQAKDLPAVEGLRRSVVMKLDFASRAMGEVAQTVDAVSKKLSGLSAPDLGSVYRETSEDVCRLCGLRMLCWESNYSDTMASFNDMTPILREKGRVERPQVTGHLARQCSRLDEVVKKVNSGYRELMVREGAWRRLAEIRAVVTDQFSGMAELLDELSEDFAAAERVDCEAAERVIAVCEAHGLSVEDAVCFVGRGSRMTVEILASDSGVKLEQGKWLREIGDACGREFDKPVVNRLRDAVKISLTEKPLYRVAVGAAQLSCTGEKLCGDAYETFYDGSGRLYAVLSDGMGSGGRAAVDGAMASSLTARLMQAGFGADSVLRMVNSALMVKSGDESLATLDIASIDLFSGRMESLKAGAAVSLLKGGGRVSRIERSSLPVGILRDIAFERSVDTLADGDILLLLSDGITAEGVGWAEEMLRDYDPREKDLNRLAEDMVIEARRRQAGEREDDVTVLALMLGRNKRAS